MYSDEKNGLRELQLPVTAQAQNDKKSKVTSWLKKVLLSLVLLKLTVGACFLINWKLFDNETSTEFKVKTVPTIPVRPENYLSKSNSAHKIYYDEEYRNASIERIAGSLRIETESYDNNPRPIEDMKNWFKFFKLHDYLEETFPLVYKHLRVEKVEKISLLYTWQGSNPDLKPLLLTAHQDVVPIDPSTRHLWKYDPYDGIYDGEFIWGRGALDCKNLLIGTLEAVEELIKDGFKPTRTVLIAFGNDEESTSFGAAALSKHIEERYGKNSLYALVDEGGGVTEVDGQQIAAPATAEKGHLDFYLELTTPGGHSSVPPDHTSIGIISKLVSLLEDNPHEASLSTKNPILHFFQVLAEDSDTFPDWLKKDLQKADVDSKARNRVLEFFDADPTLRYAVKTSQAIDVIHGGVKSNALPEFVTLTVNQRINIDSSINETIDHFLGHLKTIGEQFDLGIEFVGKVLSEPTAHGNFKVALGGPLEPAPITPSSGEVWDLFSGTIKHVYDDIFNEGTDKELKIAPFILLGNTDTKHYWDLTDNIYRFDASFTDGSALSSGIHSVNERLTPDQHLQVITFLYEYILNTDKAQ